MRASELLAASTLAALLLTPGAVMSQAAAPDPAPAAAQPAVAPASVQALKRMSAYLRVLQAFEVKADILADSVIDGDRTAQIGSTTTYKVQAPNRFTIEMVSDRKLRKVYYDGKKLTVSAPRAGYYAQVDAPPSIRETLDALSARGIDIPLEDLFQWGGPADQTEALDRGIYVGPARINGVETDQYAYSTGDVDWQIWIQRGDRPLPVRIVLSDETDPAKPRMQANLTWNVSPTFTDAEFAFVAPPGAKTITFAATTAADQ